MEVETPLPRANAAECSLIGAGLLLPERAGELLHLAEPSDFYDEFRRKLWAVMRDQHHKGGIDLARIRRELEVPFSASGDLSRDALNDLMDNAGLPVHAPADAAEIIEARRKRQRWELHYDLAQHALNGTTSEIIDQEAEAALFDWKREREATEPQWRFTAGELATKFPTLNLPVIDGIVRQGETVNLISGSKAGKSWLMDYLLLCLIVGRDVFGRYATTPGKCLLIDNELHRPTINSRLNSVAHAMGLTLDDYRDNLEIWPCRGLGWDLYEAERRIYDYTEPGQLSGVGFDALYRFYPDGVSENDNSAMKDIYNTLDRIAEYTKAANLVVHHGSKGNQSEKRVTDVGAGAGAQSRAADTHLVIREHEQDSVAVMEAALRSFPPVEPLALRWCFPLWHPADDVDPTKLRGRGTKGEERQGERDREGINTIVDALRKDGPATARQLRSKTGIGPDRQQRLLDKLHAAGQVTTTNITVRGNESREYTLVDDPE